MTTRDELYAKFGRTAEAAQLYETELGTLLLAVRAQQQGWHIVSGGETAQKEWRAINASTMGQLLGRLREQIPFEEDIVGLFTSALSARNRLVHGFFLEHGFAIQTVEGRRAMMDDLDELHKEFLNAWQQASALSSGMVALIDKEQRGT